MPWPSITSTTAIPKACFRRIRAIAHALVVLTPVYTFNQDRSEIAQIDYGDLRGGRFLEGGRQLCFALANRTPITRLAIRASALRGAIDQLAGLRGPGRVPINPDL